jgi:hypothetical protein
MKLAIIVLGALLALSCHLLAAELTPSERFAGAARLIDGLPSRSDLYHADDAIHKVGFTDQERAAALEKFKVARERIPKLRELIAVGDSVFDYPGLLAVGETLFIENRNEHPEITGKFYRLFIGITAQTGEGHVPNMFGLDFDQKGKIVSIFRPGKLVR